MNPPDPEKLERLVHKTLSQLPHRRAPHSLESRVMAAVAARALRPWWRQSFRQWPIAAKVVFVLSCTGAARLLVFFVADLEPSSVPGSLALPFAWIARLRIVSTGLVDCGHVMLHVLPPFWLYSGLAVIGALYVALFGLGAAAYRSLYLER